MYVSTYVSIYVHSTNEYVSFDHLLTITAFQSCEIYIDHSAYYQPIKLLCWPSHSLSLAS